MRFSRVIKNVIGGGESRRNRGGKTTLMHDCIADIGNLEATPFNGVPN